MTDYMFRLAPNGIKPSDSPALEDGSVRVDVASLRHNNGPLFSDGMRFCSALILDFGKTAVMVNSTPVISRSPYYIAGFELVNAGTAIDIVREYSSRMGLDISDADAFISASHDPSLEALLGDL